MSFTNLASYAAYIGVLLVYLGLGGAIIWLVVTGKIDLSQLIQEPDGKTSLSRFQFLLFTFVVAGLFLLLSIESGTFVDVPTNVGWLLGISGGSYVLAKGASALGGPAADGGAADGAGDANGNGGNGGNGAPAAAKPARPAARPRRRAR